MLQRVVYNVRDGYTRAFGIFANYLWSLTIIFIIYQQIKLQSANGEC